nr:uncharacterized protein LOC113811691 [Penaeus vannamei]
MTSVTASLLTLAWSVASFVRAVRLCEPALGNLSILDLVLLTLSHFCSIAAGNELFPIRVEASGGVRDGGRLPLGAHVPVGALAAPVLPSDGLHSRRLRPRPPAGPLPPARRRPLRGRHGPGVPLHLRGRGRRRSQDTEPHVPRPEAAGGGRPSHCVVGAGRGRRAVLIAGAEGQVSVIWVEGSEWYHWLPIFLVPVLFCLNLAFDTLLTVNSTPSRCAPLSASPVPV